MHESESNRALHTKAFPLSTQAQWHWGQSRCLPLSRKGRVLGAEGEALLSCGGEQGSSSDGGGDHANGAGSEREAPGSAGARLGEGASEHCDNCELSDRVVWGACVQGGLQAQKMSLSREGVVFDSTDKMWKRMERVVEKGEVRMRASDETVREGGVRSRSTRSVSTQMLAGCHSH